MNNNQNSNLVSAVQPAPMPGPVPRGFDPKVITIEYACLVVANMSIQANQNTMERVLLLQQLDDQFSGTLNDFIALLNKLVGGVPDIFESDGKTIDDTKLNNLVQSLWDEPNCDYQKFRAEYRDTFVNIHDIQTNIPDSNSPDGFKHYTGTDLDIWVQINHDLDPKGMPIYSYKDAQGNTHWAPGTDANHPQANTVYDALNGLSTDFKKLPMTPYGSDFYDFLMCKDEDIYAYSHGCVTSFKIAIQEYVAFQQADPNKKGTMPNPIGDLQTTFSQKASLVSGLSNVNNTKLQLYSTQLQQYVNIASQIQQSAAHGKEAAISGFLMR